MDSIIQVKQIGVNTILTKGKELFKEYAKESANSKLSITFNPSDDLYKNLEDKNVLSCFGAFNGDTLIGFLTMVTTIMPHYSAVGSTIESIFVHKDYRKGTNIFQTLTKLAIDVAKEKKSKGVFLIASVDSRLEKVLSKSSFVPTNTVYTLSI